MEESVEMKAIFYGNVQGVGFRAHACHVAKQIGLKGHIRNLADGTVQVCAQGSELKLRQLVLKLQQDFQLNPQDSARISFSKPTQPYPDFHIEH